MGDRIRVTTALHDVATGDVVSTKKVDGNVDDLFSVQDRLSDAYKREFAFLESEKRQLQQRKLSAERA